MSDDPRWGDSRERDDSRDRDLFDRDIEPRDAFMEGVNLPRGLERDLVHSRDREYSLRGSECRTLSVVGAFRVVSSRDLLNYQGLVAASQQVKIPVAPRSTGNVVPMPRRQA